MDTHHSEDDLDRIRTYLAPDDRLREEVMATHIQWEGRIFSAQTLDVRLSDGSRATRETVSHHGGAGVCAVREGHICLVRQWRVALEGMTLEIPAGKLDAGEEPEACAARELGEETGLVAERLVPVATAVGSPGFSNEATHVFHALGLSQGVAHPDAGERVDVAWVPLTDAERAISAGLIIDSKTIIAILYAVRHLDDTDPGACHVP